MEDRFKMPLYMGMDNSSSNSGSNSESKDNSVEYPSSSLGGPSSSYSGVGSADPVSSSNPNSSNTNPSSSEDVYKAGQNTEVCVPVPNESIKPTEVMLPSTQKLDSVFDRQIASLSADLTKFHIELASETDDSKIEALRDAIDATHDQLSFVQTAKFESLKKIQEGGSNSSSVLPAESSDNSKRKFSEDSISETSGANKKQG